MLFRFRFKLKRKRQITYFRGRHDSLFIFHFAPSPTHLPLTETFSLLKAGWSVCSPYMQVGEGFAILGGNCLLQVSGVTRGRSSQAIQAPHNLHLQQIFSVTLFRPFWHFSTAQSHLTTRWWQSLTVVRIGWHFVKSHWDAGTSAVSSQFGFNLTDSMTASTESLTSVKQAENCLHSRGHCELQIQMWQTKKSCGFLGRNPCKMVTTAVYGLADGWELTGSVEG